MKIHRKFILPGIVGLCLVIYIFFQAGRTKHDPGQSSRDYPQIVAEGVIHAVTEYNHTSYYVDGDTMAGFHYELMHAFARSHGLKSQISAEMAFDKQLEGLANGKYDLIAHGILATSELKDSLLLTIPIVLNHQVLVQRKDTTGNDSMFIKSQLGLAGKTVHVVKGSPSILRIHNLSNEIGDTIYINEIEKYGAEQLIAMVAHGDIEYAVCDESVASSLIDSLPQVDISTAIGFTQFHAWAVSKQSPILLDSLNCWLEKYKQSREYKKLCRKYGLSPTL